VLRPLLAALCMACGLLLLEGHWPWSGALPQLLAKMLTGAALYSAALAALWHAAGQPDGAESYLRGHMQAALRTASK
jgi:hypothetical protein